MHTLATDDWMRLARHQDEPSVTLFLPLRPRDGDRNAVRIQLRQLVEQAADGLRAMDCDPDQIAQILERVQPPRDASELPRDADTLVAFLSPSIQEVHRVDAALDERVEVGSAFALAELAAALDQPASWYVLALSDDGATLVHVDHGAPREVPLPLERADRAAANAERVHPVEGGNLHANRFNSPSTGGQPGTHPQGFGYEQVDDIERDVWYRFVDEALRAVLGDGRAPVVLVADVIHHGPFRAVSQLTNLLGDGIQHRPHLTVDELCAMARPIVVEHARPDLEAIGDRWHAAVKRGLTVTDPGEALEAARSGRIDTVYWVPRRHLPPNEATNGASSAVDDVIRQAAVHGGALVPLGPDALPDRGDGTCILNAICRW